MMPLLESQYAWGFVCGRVSVLEGQLVSEGFYSTLLQQGNTEEMLRQLQGLPFEAANMGGASGDQWTQLLDLHYTDLMLSLRHDSPNPAVVDLFLLSGEYFNLKQALTKKTLYPFPKLLITEEALAAARIGDYSRLPDFAREIAEPAEGAPREKEPALPLELMADIAYLKHYLELANTTGAPLIQAYAQEFVLSRVILLLWRARRLGLSIQPYQGVLKDLEIDQTQVTEMMRLTNSAEWGAVIGGRLGALFEESLEAREHRQPAVLEQRVSEELAKLAQLGRSQVFGPERLFAFLVAISQELYNLKLVVSGRLKRIELPILRHELRVANG